jgi:hypothetical protein
MITLLELEEATGYTSFLIFYRKVTHSNKLDNQNGFTKYYFQEAEKMKEIDLKITIEELKKMADLERD